MRFWLAAAILALPVQTLADPRDEARQLCTRGAPAAKIAGCTAVIASGQESPANLAIAYANRASAYDAQGRDTQAVADATQAIALNPLYADGYNERAWAEHGLGRDAAGLPDADKAVSLAPGDAESLETRAEIHERLGHRAAALADYRAALRLNPGLAPARDGLKRLGAD
jgi:tetratricopeptide (TPR) repeat protein